MMVKVKLVAVRMTEHEALSWLQSYSQNPIDFIGQAAVGRLLSKILSKDEYFLLPREWSKILFENPGVW